MIKVQGCVQVCHWVIKSMKINMRTNRNESRELLRASITVYLHTQNVHEFNSITHVV
jgi:hypothetical protein